MISLLRAKKPSGRFRIRWRGYDRAEVDEFLRQTAADRQHLEESLAQLETFVSSHGDARRREYERLAKLRVDVASCLETSIGALRTATQLLGNEPGLQKLHPQEAVPETTASKKPRAALIKFQWRRPAFLSHRRVQALAASVFLIAVVPTSFYYRSSAREMPIDALPAIPATNVRVESRPPAPAELLAVAPTVVVPQAEGLVLTLTARRQCWIRTRIDGGQPLERVLKADETIMLRANEEAFLRVGDASALSLLINNRLAKPLGASGEVVAARITRSNYLGLLVENPGP